MTIFEWKTSRTNGLTDMSMLQSMIMILLKTINDSNCAKSFHIFGSFPYVAWRPMKTQPHIMFIKIKNKGRYDVILGQVRFSKGQNNPSGGQKQEKHLIILVKLSGGGGRVFNWCQANYWDGTIISSLPRIVCGDILFLGFRLKIILDLKSDPSESRFCLMWLNLAPTRGSPATSEIQ